MPARSDRESRARSRVRAAVPSRTVPCWKWARWRIRAATGSACGPFIPCARATVLDRAPGNEPAQALAPARLRAHCAACRRLRRCLPQAGGPDLQLSAGRRIEVGLPGPGEGAGEGISYPERRSAALPAGARHQCMRLPEADDAGRKSCVRTCLHRRSAGYRRRRTVRVARGEKRRGTTSSFAAGAAMLCGGCTDFSSGKRETAALLAKHPKFKLIEASIADAEAVRRAIEGAIQVFHLAAIPSVPLSMAEPQRTTAVNLGGTVNVLEAARAARVRRVVLACSCAAYGDGPEQPKHENLIPRPMSPYAAQKVACELFAQTYTRAYGFPCVALRFFNVYGPRQDPQSEYAAAIPRFTTRLLAW